MSFTRLPYDICSYEQQLSETTGPGHYQLETPPNICGPCHPTDVRIRLQTNSVAINKNNHIIDVNSELLGITRNNSQCAERKYLPTCENSLLCGASTGGKHNGCQESAKLCIDPTKETLPFDNCFIGTEDTRLSNPPCNLRGTGWNRWEWLCKNPQANLEEPFDFNINTKILAKNNHRACIPNPIDQFLVHPEYNEDEIKEKETFTFCEVPTSPPSVQWQSLNVIEKY